MALKTINISKFYARLENFWNTDKYTDITIECGNKNFKCHRLILAASCDYFDAMFGGQFRERASKNITLQDISAETFEKVLHFIYTGDIPIDSENILALLQASEFFKLIGIEDLCVQFVETNGLTVQATLDILSFAYAFKKRSLLDLLCNHVAKNFDVFSKVDSFLEIPFVDLKSLLIRFTWSSMRNEDALLSAITRWINYKREERLQYYNEFVKLIRFENVSSTYMQFMFTKFFLDTHNTTLTQTLQPSGYNEDSVLQNGVSSQTETSLHVFVKYSEKKYMKAFSINSGKLCSVSDWINFSDDSHWNRIIAVDNFYLYSLHYLLDPPKPEDSNFEQNFCAYTSVNTSSELRLKSPALKFYSPITSLCAIKNNIYAYCPPRPRSSILKPITLSNSFNEEGFCVYNCEIDDWFPVPKMRQEINAGCMTAQNNCLYLIEVPYDINKVDNYSACCQMYDYRAGIWNKLPKTSYRYVSAACCSMNGKIYVSGGSQTQTLVERFDPVAGKWERMVTRSPLQKPMTYHRMVPYLNKLWLMGSFSRNSASFDFSNDLSVDVFNVEPCSWSRSSILTNKNSFGAGVIVDAVIFKS